MKTKKTFATIEKQIELSAMKLHLYRRADMKDCTQEIICRLLEGKHKNATVDQMVIDYYRNKLGSIRVKSREARVNFRDTLSLNEAMDVFTNVKTDNIIKELHKLVPGKDNKAIFGLYYLWGLTQKEIGELMDLTEAMINMELKQIIAILKEKIKNV